MTRQELIDGVNNSAVQIDLKEMVIAYIRTAYDAGFEEGMKTATKIHSNVFNVMMKKNR